MIAMTVLMAVIAQYKIKRRYRITKKIAKVKQKNKFTNGIGTEKMIT